MPRSLLLKQKLFNNKKILKKRRVLCVRNIKHMSGTRKQRRKLIVESERDNLDDPTCEDYTLMLPEHVLHHILTFMSVEDAAKVSVLSKRWRQARDTYPNVLFDQRSWKGPLISMFPKYVDDFLRRRLEHKYDFWKFKLAVECSLSVSTSDITRWLRIAVGNNVKKLSLYMDTKGNHVPYDIPSFVLAAKTLTTISLHCCILGEHDGLNLPNLRKLKLESICMTDDSLQKLISRCPSIEFLTLNSCNDLVNLEISNLEELNSFDICFCEDILMIDITARKLQCFWFDTTDESQQRVINLTGCLSLKELTLTDPTMDDRTFEQLICNCPLLESLQLRDCYSLTNVKISLSQLKSLNIFSCLNLIGGDFFVPKLESFEYFGWYNMIFSLFNSSTLRRATLQFYPQIEDLDFAHRVEFLSKLHRFLSNVDQSGGYKLVMRHEKKVAIFQRWKYLKLPQPWNMTITIIEPSMKHEKLLEKCLLYRPETLSLTGDAEWQMIMCDMINTPVVQKDKLDCCAYEIRKCWLHYLKDSSIEHSAPKTVDVDEIKTLKEAVEAEELPSTTINLSWDVEPEGNYYLHNMFYLDEF